MLLAVAAFAWLAGALYTVFVNPEIVFLKGSVKIKQAWSQKIRSGHPHSVVIYGGSSCAFSIDGERALKQHALPLVNAGLHIGLGANVLTSWALSQTRPGDTLVVALEPPLLADPFEPTTLGAQFAAATGLPKTLAAPTDPAGSVPWLSSALMVRPDATHLLTLLAKAVRRRPAYFYRVQDITASGWEQSPHRNPLPGPTRYTPALSADARTLLRTLRRWGETNQVRIVCSLPWCYSRSEAVPHFRRTNARLLIEVSDYLPVLKDSRLGAETNIHYFSDTMWHLNPEGAALRTDELAGQLANWDIWQPAELRTHAHSLATDGQP